jgi:hypothetical protein
VVVRLRFLRRGRGEGTPRRPKPRLTRPGYDGGQPGTSPHRSPDPDRTRGFGLLEGITRNPAKRTGSALPRGAGGRRWQPDASGTPGRPDDGSSHSRNPSRRPRPGRGRRIGSCDVRLRPVGGSPFRASRAFGCLLARAAACGRRTGRKSVHRTRTGSVVPHLGPGVRLTSRLPGSARAARRAPSIRRDSSRKIVVLRRPFSLALAFVKRATRAAIDRNSLGSFRFRRLCRLWRSGGNFRGRGRRGETHCRKRRGLWAKGGCHGPRPSVGWLTREVSLPVPPQLGATLGRFGPTRPGAAIRREKAKGRRHMAGGNNQRDPRATAARFARTRILSRVVGRGPERW